MLTLALSEPKIKEYPISFKAEMIRAILENRKTQTRRVVKPQPDFITHSGVWAWDRTGRAADLLIDSDFEVIRAKILETSRYGRPGAHLWIKEIFGYDKDGPHTGPLEFKATYPGSTDEIVWKPSIFMPRWASRITLEVVNLRVERLHQMTLKDIKAEGAGFDFVDRQPDWDDAYTYYQSYKNLWEKINGKEGEHSWSENPFVRVIEFRKIEPNGFNTTDSIARRDEQPV